VLGLLFAAAMFSAGCSDSAGLTNCESDSDCSAAGLTNPYCNTVDNSCHERGDCETNADCGLWYPDMLVPYCNSGGVCIERGPCSADNPCPYGECDLTSGTCVGGTDGDITDGDSDDVNPDGDTDGDTAPDGDDTTEEDVEQGPACPNVAGNYDVTIDCNGAVETGTASVLQAADECDAVIYYPGGVLQGTVDIVGHITTTEDKTCTGDVSETGLNLTCDDGCTITGGINTTTSGEIHLEPPVVDFQNAIPGLMHEKTLEISNVGEGDLTINQMILSPGCDPGFSLDMQEVTLPTTVARNDFVEVMVKFETLDEVYLERHCTLLISNSSATAVKGVDILAKQKDVCVIEIEPAALNFGSVPTGYTEPRSFLVKNVGDADCLLSNLEITNDGNGAYSMGANNPDTSGYGYVISPRRSATVEALYHPILNTHQMGETVSGMLQVTTTNPNNLTETGWDVPLTGDVVVPAPPCIHVEPIEGVEWMDGFPAQAGPGIRFGMTELFSMSTRQMTITNCGDEDLIITKIETGMIFPPCGWGGIICPEYTFMPPMPMMAPVTIPRGGNYNVDITFNPTVEGTLESWSLVVYSNAFVSDIPEVTTPGQIMFGISGIGATRDIAVLPSKIDYGLITLGCCSRDETITVYDTGELELEIQEIRMSANSDAGFELRGLPQLPFNLTGGTSFNFHVRFCAPVDGHEGPYTGVVEIVSNDATEAVFTVPVQAEGTTLTHQVDNFHQNEKPTVDIMWVVDCSGSMGEEQDNLADNFGTFVNTAVTWNADIQVGVVSCSMDDAGHSGRLQGSPKVLKYGGVGAMDRTAFVNAFEDNIKLGTSCSGTEKGLEASNMSLSPPLITDPAENAEFLRENAGLVVVYVSDEEDQSIPDTGYYVDFLRNIKGFQNREMLQVYGIVGDCPGGCQNQNTGEAGEGCRYSDVAAACGGFEYSICANDWTTIYEDIGNRAFGLRRQFFLTRLADPTTIVVDVRDAQGNSVPMEEGTDWVYDDESNSIIFTDAPPAGADITIEYDTLCLH